MSFSHGSEDVDARHEAGHDEFVERPAIRGTPNPLGDRICDSPALWGRERITVAAAAHTSAFSQRNAPELRKKIRPP